MSYLEAYLERLRQAGNTQLASAVKETADAVDQQCLESFSFVNQVTGLLFGNVQSGKTSQLFGIMCRAADKGFALFVLLTTDNVALQQQTLHRVQADLQDFCVCGEEDVQRFENNNLTGPVVVVLKKNYHVLRRWCNIMMSTRFLIGNPLIIADDEADAASLNTLVNNSQESTIYKYLNQMRDTSASGIYLEVTGTPQALLLQTKRGKMKPAFVHYFKPGPGYLGGDFFFPTDHVPKCIRFIEDETDPVRSAVAAHLTSAAIMLTAGARACNALFHPGVRTAQHSQLAADVRKALAWAKANEASDLRGAVAQAYEASSPVKYSKPPFDEVYAKARALIDDSNVLLMNSDNDLASNQYDAGCNFIVGGNKLGRGITFPALQTVFYTRTSKRPQADTMWQHNRVFGYDRDPGLMNLFIGHELYKLFSDINATNRAIIQDIETDSGDISVFYPDSIQPTRSNVLDKTRVAVLSGGTNYYPADPKNNTFDEISKMLEHFSDDEPYYPVSCNLIQALLGHIVPSVDFNLPAFQSAIKAAAAQTPMGQGILIVRRNRAVAQWTGALLSPNDWELGGQFPSRVVLTMYQVTGTKGWGKHPLWVPNVKLPSGQVYYDVQEDNE